MEKMTATARLMRVERLKRLPFSELSPMKKHVQERMRDAGGGGKSWDRLHDLSKDLHEAMNWKLDNGNF